MSGTWIQTHSRKRFEIIQPDPDAVCIEDIAHALARLCRFAGHVGHFYSVAQHSVITAKLIAEELNRPDIGMAALLHDAAEAYIGDLSRPLKVAIGSKIRQIETGVQSAVWSHFGITPPTERDWRLIMAADNVALQTEVRDLMGGPREDWCVDWPEVFEHDVMDRTIVPLLPEEAEAQFMASYRNLSKARK